jgi:hypothetical protein
MVKTHILKVAMLCATLAMVSFTTSKSFAGTETSDDKKEVKPLVQEIKKSCITGDIGVTVVSQYVSRGLIFENKGAIVQPYADLYFNIYQGDGFLNSVTLNLSIWDSIQSKKTDASPGSTVSDWYESDADAGISFTFDKIFTFTPSYYSFYSPNNGFATFQGINLNLAMDDSQFLGAFALHPHVTTLFEISNKAGNGKRKGVYYEVGVAPALPTFAGVTVTLPLTVGLGSHDFYSQGRGFGYFSAGAIASYSLPFIPSCLGSWAINGGVTYYYLGSALHDFNVPLHRANNHNEFVFSGGLGITF